MRQRSASRMCVSATVCWRLRVPLLQTPVTSARSTTSAVDATPAFERHELSHPVLTMFKKLAPAAFAAALALALFAPSVQAQKALVYCPVGVDAAGCDRIVAALQSKFSDGVDRGYDGSAGTIDLTKADLNHYGVVVVPSLADNADKQPYAVLRSAAARLRLAINGRVAVYSGAPDQGSANREDKDVLIQNLAG